MDRGTPFWLEVEVEYGGEPEDVRRILATRVDETDVGLKPERGARFSDDLETKDVENIALLGFARWGSVTELRTERRSSCSGDDRDLSRHVASNAVATEGGKIQNTRFTCAETRYTIVVYG